MRTPIATGLGAWQSSPKIVARTNKEPGAWIAELRGSSGKIKNQIGKQKSSSAAFRSRALVLSRVTTSRYQKAKEPFVALCPAIPLPKLAILVIPAELCCPECDIGKADERRSDIFCIAVKDAPGRAPNFMHLIALSMMPLLC